MIFFRNNFELFSEQIDDLSINIDTKKSKFLHRKLQENNLFYK